MPGGGVRTLGAPGWVPSCCGWSLERGRGSDPSCLPEMAPVLGRVPDEGSLPSGGQGWTSLREAGNVWQQKEPLRGERREEKGERRGVKVRSRWPVHK